MRTTTMTPAPARTIGATTPVTGLTLYALRMAVEDAVLARIGDDLTPAELRDEVLLEIEDTLGVTRGELLAEGLDAFADTLASRARAEAA